MATPVQLKALLDLSAGATFNETSADCYDISDIVMTANTRRGRSRQLDRIESGYAVITVNDENGDFNPDNEDSPYYGKLRPGNKLRLYPEYNDGTGDFRYPDMFTGFIYNYTTRFSMGVNSANQIVIEANDAFKIFNSVSITEVTNSTSGDSSDERLEQILDEIDWPAGLRVFETSALSLADDQGDLRTALDAIRQVEDTEVGLVFIDGSGNVVFKNRTTANTSPDYGDAYKFSDDGTETSYNDLRLTQNDDILVNRITVKSYNGSSQVTVYNTTSEDDYFTRSAERNNVLLTSTTELTDIANQLLTNYKDSSLQIDRIILNLTEYQVVDRVVAGLYFDIFFIPLYISKQLSGNTTISRLGWVQGVNHDITPTTWYVTAFTGSTQITELQQIAVAHYTTPYISVYQWSSAGYGAKYSNPATLPVGNGTAVAFSKAGTDIAIAHTSSPYISVYPWSKASGFGSKYSDPATLPTGTGQDVTFSPTDNNIAIVHTTSPFITAYPWSSTGFGTKYSNPATLPTSTGLGVEWSPSGNDIAVAHENSPRVTAYPWSGSGFGTKYANPATLPASFGDGIAWSPSGNDIAVAHLSSPYVTAWAWSAGFGTKYANPATLPTDSGRDVAWSPSGSDIAVSFATSPYISVYPWSAGFGTKYSDPATLPAGDSYNIAWSLTGSDLAVTHINSPYITTYPWTISGFGTKYANPASLPAGIGRGVAFNSV